MAAVVASIVWSAQPVIVVLSSSVRPETVMAGGVIRVEREVKRARPDCGRGELFVKIVDSHRVVRALEPIKAPSTSPPPAQGQVGSSWPVPDNMPPGESIFRSYIEFPCFPFFSLWPVRVDLPDVEFTVMPITNGMPPLRRSPV